MTKTTTAAPDVTGPADTDDPTVIVSTATPRPAGSDLLTGTTAGTTEIPARPDHPDHVAALRLADEERWESYELVAPGGEICEVTRNIDTGEHNVERTGRYASATAAANIAN